MKKIKFLSILLIAFCLTANNSFGAWALFWKRTTPRACPEGQKPPCYVVDWCILCEVPSDNSTVKSVISKAEVISSSADSKKVRLTLGEDAVTNELLQALSASKNNSVIDGGIITEKMCRELGLSKEFIGKNINPGKVDCAVGKPRRKGGWPPITITITIKWK